MPRLQVNPHTKTEGKMVKIHVYVFPEEKAKLCTKAKKSKYNGSTGEVIRELIREMK